MGWRDDSQAHSQAHSKAVVDEEAELVAAASNLVASAMQQAVSQVLHDERVAREVATHRAHELARRAMLESERARRAEEPERAFTPSGPSHIPPTTNADRRGKASV